jgi:hypothetical protein
MQLLQILTVFKYYNKKISTIFFSYFHKMMEDLYNFLNLDLNNLTHHFLIEIPNLYWE